MISHQFHSDFTTIQNRFHSNFTTFSIFYRAKRGDFFSPGTRAPGTHNCTSISQRFHTVSIAISQHFHIFTARSAAKFFTRAPGTHPEPTRNRPSHGRATPRHTRHATPQISPRSPRHTENRRTHAPTQLRLARPHARHARHEPKPKSISRLGSQKDSPPNLQYRER